MEEKLFNNSLHMEIWLDKVLHTDESDSVYERNQICAGGITVPVLSVMNREQLKKTILATFTPFLRFLTYYTWESHEKSSLLAADLSYYAPDALDDLFHDRVTLVTFLELSGEEVVRHVLSMQNHHKQTLDMAHIYKRMVMGYLLEEDMPFDFTAADSGFYLHDRQTGREVRRTCKDTNSYVRLFQEWQVMKNAYERRTEAEKARKLLNMEPR